MGSYEKSNGQIWTTDEDFGLKNDEFSTIDVPNGSTPTSFRENEKSTIENEKDDGNETSDDSVKKSLIGFAWGVLASFLIAVGTACVQLLEGDIPDFQLTFMRSSVQLFFPVVFYCYKRRLPRVRRQLWGWLFVYCLFVTCFNITNYLAVNYIAAGIASSIRRSVNIIGIAILATLFLKERVTLPKVAGVLLSVVGVVMCVQPWYDQGTTSNNNNSNNSGTTYPRTNVDSVLRRLFVYVVRGIPEDAHHFEAFNETNVTTMNPGNDDDNEGLGEIFGYSMAFVAGVAISFGNFLIKFRLQEVSASTLNVYCGLFGTIIPIIVSITTEKMTFPTEPEKIVYALGQATCWGLAAVVGVRAISKGSIVLITLAFALQIVFLLIAQYTFLSHINPGVGNWVEIAGVVLVVVAAVLPSAWEAVQFKLRSSRKDQSESGSCFQRNSRKYAF